MHIEMAKIQRFEELLCRYIMLKEEREAPGLQAFADGVEKTFASAIDELKKLPETINMPDDLKQIQALRPPGPRKIWRSFDAQDYRERLAGAMLGRFAGCTLGAIVEFWTEDDMVNLAQANGQPFPPVDYWTEIPFPWQLRYHKSRRDEYTRDRMNGVPVDDDIVYTQLGLLILEDCGPDFTVSDVGRSWLKYLPYACTAEHVALSNLKNGVPAESAADIDNPYCAWIGADIRSDPWGYAAPGLPEAAAEMAWHDAYISHRQEGIYGEMYFSAVIAAAFTVNDPVEALQIGLTEIPAECALAKAVKWALDIAPSITNWKDARTAVDKQFPEMSRVHTVNNACLTVFGITIGKLDITRVIGETVAMGMDNDCTAATAGSIVGAVIGRKNIPAHWYRNFNDTAYSYLNGYDRFGINDMLDRFTAQARKRF